MSKWLRTRLAELIDGASADGVNPARGEDVAAWRAAAHEALDSVCRGAFVARIDSPVSVLVREPMPAGLEASPGRGILAGELLRNLADPGLITQGRKGTCAPTVVETYLAVVAPGEYARIVASLATTGRVTLKGGHELVRDGDDPLVWTEEEGRRSPASRLFQVAALEAASATLDYDDAQDRQIGPDGQIAGAGMKADAFDVLIEAATGATWERWSATEYGFAKLFAAAGLGSPLELATVLDAADAAIADGDFGFATLAPTDVDRAALQAAMGGFVPEGSEDGPSLHRVVHKVRIVRVEADRVWFDDPLDPEAEWLGQGARIEDGTGRCSMPRDTFSACVADVSLRAEYWPAV